MQLGFNQSAIASCAFGSVHKKPFRLLSFLLDGELPECPLSPVGIVMCP